MSRNGPKIAVVGAGAVGAYYGAMLAFAGENVHFLFRSDYATVARDGLVIQKPDGERRLHPVQAYKQAEDIGPCDLVIIALKATSNKDLPPLLEPLLKPDTALLTLQNGLGNEELLADRFGAGRVMGGLCFICLNRIAPGVVKNFFPGYLVVGDFQETAGSARGEWLAERFHEAGVKCLVAESLLEARWRKLVWNIPFNGLAIAAGGVDTARILADARLRELARKLMYETVEIAHALGITIEEAFIQRQFELTDPMGPYKPSSVIDYLAGRPVEVEAIWGEPLRRGHELNVEAPRLEMLYALIKGLTPGSD